MLDRRRFAWRLPARRSAILRCAGRASENVDEATPVSQLLAAGPSACEQSPATARVPRLRDGTRGRRPSPREPAQPVCVPSGERTGIGLYRMGWKSTGESVGALAMTRLAWRLRSERRF